MPRRPVADRYYRETHMDGINVAYCDGHVKWVRWEKSHTTKATLRAYLPWWNVEAYPPGY